MQNLEIIDSHTGGESTRIVVGGLPDEIALAAHGSMAKRARILSEKFDWIRTSLCNEPRGSEVMVGAVCVEPSDPDCDAGIIFFNNVGLLGMCGHGTMALAVVLNHLGRTQPGLLRVDTPVGGVEATLENDGATVSIQNVPAFRYAEAVALDVPALGKTVHGDISWGGNWFFMVSDHGIDVDPAHMDELTQAAQAIQARIEESGLMADPDYLDGTIDHIELFGPPSDPALADSRSYVLCPGKQYDRSPCGTGVSAKVASLAASGTLPAGQLHRQESFIGSVFQSSWVPGSKPGLIVPTITGKAWVNGRLTVLFDPTDPFAAGIPRL